MPHDLRHAQSPHAKSSHGAAEFLETIRCRQLFLHVTPILGICEGFIEVDLVVRGTDLLGFD